MRRTGSFHLTKDIIQILLRLSIMDQLHTQAHDLMKNKDLRNSLLHLPIQVIQIPQLVEEEPLVNNFNNLHFNPNMGNSKQQNGQPMSLHHLHTPHLFLLPMRERLPPITHHPPHQDTPIRHNNNQHQALEVRDHREHFSTDLDALVPI